MNSYQVEVRWNSAIMRFEALGFSDLLMSSEVEASLRREAEIEQKLAEASTSRAELETMSDPESRDYTSAELDNLTDAWLLAQEGKRKESRTKARHLAEYLRLRDQCCAVAEHICNAQAEYLQTRDPERLVNQTYLAVGEAFDWNEATTRRTIQRMHFQLGGWQLEANTLMSARTNPGVIFLVARALRARPTEGAPALKCRLAGTGITMSERNVGKMLKKVRESMQPMRSLSDF